MTATMRLWLLTRTHMEDVDWDEYRGFVVRAVSAAAARQIAYKASGGFEDAAGEPYWLDPTQTSCVELVADGPDVVILADFKAG